MDMHTKNQYLQVLQDRYFMAKSKKEKSLILDEYCRNTGQKRKYVVRKINHYNFSLKKKRKRNKSNIYNLDVVIPLIKIWEIFDYPCGQRLVPLLKSEVERLRDLKELSVVDEVAEKLKKISPVTIDRKLRKKKEELILFLQNKKRIKPSSLLLKRIPIKVCDWNISKLGYVAMDLVIHCGYSSSGLYICSLNTVEISTGWWEAEGTMGKRQVSTFEALKNTQSRRPFKTKGYHSDNDASFINDILFRYCQENELEFSRSRPNKKNDNPYVEQKNFTHVRKMLGYFRYDSEEELEIINSLYRDELRLYRNFFCPVMKLIKKERIGSKIKKEYDNPKTPYQRVMESREVSQKTKKELKKIYLGLNPAELKRKIDEKLNMLYKVYERSKNEGRKLDFYNFSDTIEQKVPQGLPIFENRLHQTLVDARSQGG